MSPKVVLIKKYENRRLYDTVNSRYVNLDDVARLLQDGATVRVVDAATGEDITRLILTQIIVEDAKGPDSIFPLEVLRQMVLASSRATQQGAVQYMQSLMDMYQRSLRLMSPVFPWAGAAQQDAGNAETPADAAPSHHTGSEKPASGPSQASGDLSRTSNPPEDRSEIEQLRSRLAELEAAVSGLKSKPAFRKSASSHDPASS